MEKNGKANKGNDYTTARRGVPAGRAFFCCSRKNRFALLAPGTAAAGRIKSADAIGEDGSATVVRAGPGNGITAAGRLCPVGAALGLVGRRSAQDFLLL